MRPESVTSWMRKVFTEAAWDDYLYWERKDKRTLRRINQLIRDIERDPFNGLGKPERLRFDLSGCYTRRIDTENRLVYTVEDGAIVILSCKDHY